MIDELIGVHVSSIVNWGYQDNFRPVYYFFYEKILNAKKAPKRKTSDFHPFRSFYAQKTVVFVVFCSLIFVLLVYVCLWVFLYARNLFVKKKNKQVWNCLDSLNSLYYWKFISSIIKNSFICKRVECHTLKYSVAPDLPLTMVAFSPAFTHTGVDLRKIYDSQNMYKAWNFSFTCLSSRVISSKLEPSCDPGKSIKDGFLWDIAFQKVFYLITVLSFTKKICLLSHLIV